MAFDAKAAENVTKLPKGQKLVFRWRVVVHPGDVESTRLGELYKEFAAKR